MSPTSVNITFQNADGGGVITASTPVGASGTAVSQAQTIDFQGISGGTFQIAYSNGVTTATTGPITFSTATATLASNITNALNTLSTLGSGNVAVTASSSVATITFQGTLAGQPETNLFTVINPALVNTVQNVTFPAGTTGGSFTLTVAGATTGLINYSTTVATLQSAIQTALNTALGTGLATVSAVSATSVNITYAGTDGGGVVQTAPTGNGTTVLAEESISFLGNTGGTFVLTYNGTTTGTINYSTSIGTVASNIQAALNALTPSPNVSVALAGSQSVNIFYPAGTLISSTVASDPVADTTGGATVLAAYTVSLTSPTTATQFKLTFNGSTTGAIAYNANPGILQANIQARAGCPVDHRRWKLSGHCRCQRHQY